MYKKQIGKFNKDYCTYNFRLPSESLLTNSPSIKWVVMNYHATACVMIKLSHMISNHVHDCLYVKKQLRIIIQSILLYRQSVVVIKASIHTDTRISYNLHLTTQFNTILNLWLIWNVCPSQPIMCISQIRFCNYQEKRRRLDC